MYMGTKQGYALKNWVEVLSDEAHYPWESQKNRLKSVNPPISNRISTEQLKYKSGNKT